MNGCRSVALLLRKISFSVFFILWMNPAVSRAQFFIRVVLSLDFAGLHRHGYQDVTNQKTPTFVKTDHWIGGGVGQSIQRQDALHLGQKGRI